MSTGHKIISSFFSAYKTEVIIALCWLGVQSWLFYQHGVVTEYEAMKYIAEADNILDTGHVSTPNFWLYSTQIFLIALAKKLHTGYLPVVVVQWFFNALATIALYNFARRMSNKMTGAVITLLLVFNFPFQTFNSFLQTESLFHSFTLLFSCYLLSIQRLTLKRFIAIILFLSLLSITRPTGLLWVPAAFLFLFFRFFRKFPFALKIGITLAASVIFLFVLNQALGSGGELDFMLPFRDERIICGVPTLPHFVDIKVSDNPNSLEGLFYYITHNFGQFTRMAWLRSCAFFGLYRSYYSAGHNLYLAAYFYPIFILALVGAWRWLKLNKQVPLYCLTLISITWITVILTCDDWHNRFFLTIVPYIYILSIPAIKKIVDKIRPNERTANLPA